MTGDPRALSAARAGVARAVAAEPRRLRRCSASVLLAFTSAAALAPLLVAGGPALATAALAGVAGNVGSGMLTNVLDRAIARLGVRSRGWPTPTPFATTWPRNSVPRCTGGTLRPGT